MTMTSERKICDRLHNEVEYPKGFAALFYTIKKINTVIKMGCKGLAQRLQNEEEEYRFTGFSWEVI